MFTVPIFDYLSMLLTPTALISLGALIVLVVILAVISRKTAYNTRTLTYASLSIALAFILWYIKILQLPNGGTITVASMLPIFVFSYVAGPRAGMAAGFCFGLLHYLQEPFFVNPIQFLLDYPIPFALLGLAGAFKENIYLGAVAGSFLRFACHFLSGVLFFGQFAQEAGQNVFWYSISYNGSYMLPDMVICLAILAIPNLKSAINRLKLARA